MVTEVIINQRWLDFKYNDRAPSKWGEYDTICTNWILSRDPIGRLSILYLFLFRWEFVLVAQILDIMIVILLALIIQPIKDVFKSFANKFLGFIFGILAIFVAVFFIYFLFKSGLCVKLYDLLSALFVS